MGWWRTVFKFKHLVQCINLYVIFFVLNSFLKHNQAKANYEVTVEEKYGFILLTFMYLVHMNDGTKHIIHITTIVTSVFFLPDCMDACIGRQMAEYLKKRKKESFV